MSLHLCWSMFKPECTWCSSRKPRGLYCKQVIEIKRNIMSATWWMISNTSCFLTMSRFKSVQIKWITSSQLASLALNQWQRTKHLLRISFVFTVSLKVKWIGPHHCLHDPSFFPSLGQTSLLHWSHNITSAALLSPSRLRSAICPCWEESNTHSPRLSYHDRGDSTVPNSGFSLHSCDSISNGVPHNNDSCTRTVLRGSHLLTNSL